MVELVDSCCWYFSNPIGMSWERGLVRGGEEGTWLCDSQTITIWPWSTQNFFILSHCSRQLIRYRFWWLPSEATFSLLRQPEYFQFSLWFGRLRLLSAQLLCRRWRVHVPDCTNTQGLKITMENVLSFLWHLVNHNHYNFLINHSVIVIGELVAIMGQLAVIGHL